MVRHVVTTQQARVRVPHHETEVVVEDISDRDTDLRSAVDQWQCIGKPALRAGHCRDRRRGGGRHAATTGPELVLVDLAIALILNALRQETSFASKRIVRLGRQA